MAVSWEDRAIVLSVRTHGEHDAIVTVFGADQGRSSGMVKGGASRRLRSQLQAGNLLKVWWRARLEDQLGTMTCEPLQAIAGMALDNPLALAGVSALCAMIDVCLPERESHRALFDRTLEALTEFSANGDGAHYARWEVDLLRELGFGLDLSVCAVTGSDADLVYVSPKTGRAVSRQGAGTYADRLLVLPSFLRSGGQATPDDVRAALRLTGHFLDGHAFAAQGRHAPAARARFVDLLKS
ncbi:MAG: DNA repair protein RecO [Alphaproteobacteria bacterium]|nr:DNA repair protein RecO [Alphaproteobacteria bacterium]